MRGRRRGCGGLLGLAILALQGQGLPAQAGSVGRIEGVVENVLGEPMPAVRVWVTEPGGLVLAATTTDGTGRFLCETVPVAGRWTVRAAADGYAEARDEIVPGHTRHVTRLCLREAASVAVTVVDDKGAGVAGAEVVLADPREVRFEASGRCDVEGRVKFERVPLGLVDVGASAKGMRFGVRRVLLAADATVSVALEPGDGVGLRVEIDGLPAEARCGVSVEGWSWFGPVPSLPQSLRSVELDASGRGSVSGLPDCGLVIKPSGEGLAFEPREIRFEADAAERVARFRATVLERSVLRGRLEDEHGMGIPGELIEIAERERVSAVTGADGAFEVRSYLQPEQWFTALLPTSSWVMAQDRPIDWSLGGGSWRVHEGGFFPGEDVVLVATKAAVISGRLVGSEGEGVAYQTVYLEFENTLDEGWRQFDWDRTDRDGRFSFPRQRPQFGRLRVVADGLSGRSVIASPEKGGEFDVGELRLPRGGTVTGVVRDGEGKPVAGARVWLNGWDRGRGTWRRGTEDAFTDRRGRYRFAGVAAGGFVLVAGWIRMNTQLTDVDPFTVEDGEKVVVDIKAGDVDELMSGR